MTQKASEYRTEAILRDGGSVVVRAMRPDDKARLLEHFARLSARSVYFRFFGVKKRLTDEELTRFTDLDFTHHVALVATLVEDGTERIIGVGRFHTLDDAGKPWRADVAFAVADEHQGRGIGTLLLEHLVPIARALGVTEFRADVLGENNRMLDVFTRSGFVVHRSLDGGVFTLTFPTAATPEFIEASLAREQHATAESVHPLLEPRAIALVGASRDPDAIGGVLLRNIRASFHGPVYPVHPTAAELQGVRAYPRVGAIGAPVDLAVIAVPAAAVEAVVAECAHAGVRGLVIISSGFGEVAGESRTVETRLREQVRACGMRLVGPNCMGVINTDPERGVNATFAPVHPPRGGSRCCRRAAPSGSRSSTTCARAISASRTSCRSATRPTSRATTCSPTAARIPAPR